MKPKLLVATRNAGKQREIRALLADTPWDVVFPDDRGLWERPEESHIEDADSFEGNARRKAEYFARLSGLPTLAEDSGIEVFALGGAPGVRSRRFAFPPLDDVAAQDAANNAELLRRLAGAPDDRRRARYRCVVCFLERPDGIPHVFEGSCLGRIPVRTGGHRRLRRKRRPARPSATFCPCQAAPGIACAPINRDSTICTLLAGDYVYTALNVGCLEAATLSGIDAARAILQRVGSSPDDGVQAAGQQNERSALPRFIRRGGDLIIQQPLACSRRPRTCSCSMQRWPSWRRCATSI